MGTMTVLRVAIVDALVAIYTNSCICGNGLIGSAEAKIAYADKLKTVIPAKAGTHNPSAVLRYKRGRAAKHETSCLLRLCREA
jgi:hypothetical protein